MTTWTKGLIGGAVVGLAGMVAFSQVSTSSAADVTNPQATHGALTLAAATATAIPTSCLTSRGAVAVQNLDSADIYCGSDNSVTATGASGGIKITSGQLATIYVSCGTSKAAKVWCYSAAGTAANALRYMETR